MMKPRSIIQHLLICTVFLLLGAFSSIAAGVKGDQLATGAAAANLGAVSSTVAAIPSTHFAPGVSIIVTSGTSAAGDSGGGCRYVRGSNSGPNAVADVDGVYWQLAPPDVSIAVCWGAMGDNSTIDGPAIRKALTYLNAHVGNLRFPYGTSGTYVLDATTVTVSGTVGITCDAGVSIKPDAVTAYTAFLFSGSYGGLKGCTFTGNTSTPTTAIPVVVESASGGQLIEDNRFNGFQTAISAKKGNAVKINRNRVEYCGSGNCVVIGGVVGEFFGDATWVDNVVLPHSTTGRGMLIDGGTNAQYMLRLEINGGGVGIRSQFTGGTAANPQNIWCWDCNIDAANTAELDIAACWLCEFHGSNLSGTLAGPGLLFNASAAGTIDGFSCFNCQIQGNYMQGVDLTAGRNIRFYGGTLADNSAAGVGSYPGVEVRAGARGVFWMQGVMGGLSAAGQTGWGHNLNGQSYAVQLDSGCLTNTAPDAVAGVLVIQGNFFTGNTSGAISGTCGGASASTTTPNF